MAILSSVRGILFDLDGVLYVGDQMIVGADTVIRQIKQKGIPFRFVTNTTTQSRDTIAAKSRAMGLSIQSHEIISTPSAAMWHLKHQGYRNCHLVVADQIKHEFEGFATVDSDPDVVVLGDIGDAWNYDLLNKVFGMLMGGSRLVALHKNKFWQTREGLRMDIGAFVAGLEYVTGKTATVIGKPSPDFFQMAISQLNLPAEQVVMVGDDIDSDIGGAQRAGLKAVLVRTGKYRAEYAASSPIVPDEVLDSVVDLADML